MKKMFSYWVLCLMAFATSALVSCSSDDNGDEWGGFKFENVRDGKLSVAANQTLIRNHHEGIQGLSCLCFSYV